MNRAESAAPTSAGAASPSLHVEPVNTFRELEPEWATLAAESGNVFATPEWLGTWWRHFGRDRPLLVGAVRSSGDGALRAISPFYLATRGPVRVLRLIGHGPTDQLGPVCAPDDRRDVASSLRPFLDRAGAGWDVVIADELPAGVAWPTELGGTLLARETSLVTDLTGTTADDWLARRSANLRSSVRRGERTLAAQGAVRFRRTRYASELSADLDSFFRLHAERWRSSGGSRAFVGREAFHREFARLALERGWLRLRFLELDGRPVAALYNLAFAGHESFYQSGRDRRFDHCSPGLLLHAYAIRDALDAGCVDYRFLRGDEPYKRRLADRETSLETVGAARTTAGRAALAALSRLPRLPRSVRRRIPAAYSWGSGGAPRWGRT